VIKERNPFPAVIGRICPRPCELDCRRNFIDEPVAINFLKRYAADYEKDSGERILPYQAPDTGRRVAVIGGGVEGLSTAFFVARLGHETTVFEGTSKLGGLLRSAISADRLPEEMLNWDIDGIVEMGVKMKTDAVLGRDFSVDSLLDQGFSAVFIAAGGWDSRLARGAVDELESPIPGTFMLVDAIRFGSTQSKKFSCGSDVVICGGGKIALQAAKTCKDLGAQTITILFRESWENSPIRDADLEGLGKDGINVVYEAAINRLLGEKDQLVELEYIQPDRFEKTTIPAQTLILAAGRFPELIFLKPEPSAPQTEAPAEPRPDQSVDSHQRWEAFPPYKRPKFKGEVGLFAQGDVLADYSAAIKAIGAGRRAAASIHQIMYGIEPTLSENVITPQATIQNVDQVERVDVSQRQIMPICSGPRHWLNAVRLKGDFPQKWRKPKLQDVSNADSSAMRSLSRSKMVVKNMRRLRANPEGF
jgi:NADPH-dependent glutamate synthase beta subunit-like oxidoreductase